MARHFHFGENPCESRLRSTDRTYSFRYRSPPCSPTAISRIYPLRRVVVPPPSECSGAFAVTGRCLCVLGAVGASFSAFLNRARLVSLPARASPRQANALTETRSTRGQTVQCVASAATGYAEGFAQNLTQPLSTVESRSCRSIRALLPTLERHGLCFFF